MEGSRKRRRSLKKKHRKDKGKAVATVVDEALVLQKGSMAYHIDDPRNPKIRKKMLPKKGEDHDDYMARVKYAERTVDWEKRKAANDRRGG